MSNLHQDGDEVQESDGQEVVIQMSPQLTQGHLRKHNHLWKKRKENEPLQESNALRTSLTVGGWSLVRRQAPETSREQRGQDREGVLTLRLARATDGSRERTTYLVILGRETSEKAGKPRSPSETL